MKFKSGREPDYVAEELRIALKAYRKNPNDRLLLVVKPGVKSKDEETVVDVADEIHEILNHKVLYITCDELMSDDEPILRDILKNVTEVKRRNLWNAGYHWLEQSIQPGSRFANLNFDESIMPFASEKKGREIRLPIRAHLEREEDAPLMDMIRNTPGHLYLIGEGGIGKTTALYSIMKHVYGPD